MERACFSPLVSLATGGMGPVAMTVYRKLASILAGKWKMNYSRCLFWVRCRLCYSLLRSGVMCLRGHKSCSSPMSANVELAYSEGRLDVGALELFHFSCWCHPAVQHLTPSAGSGRQGQSIKPRGGKKCRTLVVHHNFLSARTCLCNH